jgi:hypothetical protein
MLLLPPTKLAPVLALILTLLTIHSSSATSPSPKSPSPSASAPSSSITRALEDDHDLPTPLGLAVLELFGTIEEGMWEADVRGMVKEVGKGLLEGLKGPMGRDGFLRRWKEQVGESWEGFVQLKLLEVGRAGSSWHSAFPLLHSLLFLSSPIIWPHSIDVKQVVLAMRRCWEMLGVTACPEIVTRSHWW